MLQKIILEAWKMELVQLYKAFILDSNVMQTPCSCADLLCVLLMMRSMLCSL